MKITTTLRDDSILAELGQRLTSHRLALELTQAQLAKQAGLSKRTVERIEAGYSAQLSSLIRLLRVLGLLPALESSIPAPPTSPIELLRNQGRPRERARSGVRKPAKAADWTWDDET
jgi:transcriptional regulator with XRE-family HTH domain